jgi:hypothetical protein
MKLITKITRVRNQAALIGTSILLLAGIHSSQAAEIKIASPIAYLNREGEECFCRDSEPPYRYQQVFPAADFAALGNQPHWIVGFGPRADESVTSPHTAYLPENYIRLSTTQLEPGNQHPVFDANFGSDVSLFYEGPLTMVADVGVPGPGPNGFYRADFPAGVTPFLYDPNKGNLPLDFIASQGESPKVLADQIPSLRSVGGDPFATQGNLQPAAIFQFTFVPVPRQLIINGGFETPDTSTYMQINAGQNSIAPWVVGLHSVEVGDAVGNGFITGPAFEGGQFLDLNGLQTGQITQAFATTPGSLYTLTFAYTDNYWEPAAPGPASAGVRVFDGLGDRLNQTITHTGAVAGDYQWAVFTGQFTALTDTTSLEFTSLSASASGHSGGMILDAVQVTLSLRATLALQGSGAILNWTGGTPPYRVQRPTDLTLGDWTDVLTNAVPPVTLTLEAGAEFYRVVGQ